MSRPIIRGVYSHQHVFSSGRATRPALDERVLLKDGQPLALTPKALDSARLPRDEQGRLLTKDEILRGVWLDAVVEESNLAYHVSAIRKVLGDGSDPD